MAVITTKLYIPMTTPSHQIWDLSAPHLKGETLIAFHVMADFQRLKCLLLGKTHQSDEERLDRAFVTFLQGRNFRNANPDIIFFS